MDGRGTRYPAEVAVAALLAAFVGLKVYAGFPYLFDDEHRYFAMGQLMSLGQIPYRDFILTHPPLGILLIGLCDWIFGSHYLLYKGLLLFFSALTGLVLFATVRHEHGPLAACFACGLFLTAETYYIESSFMRGFNLGLLLIALGSYFSRRLTSQRPAGVLFGLGFLTGLYAIIPLSAFVVFQFWTRGIRAAGDMIAGFLLVTIPVQLLFLALSGSAYVTQVYLLHTYREAGWIWTLDILRQIATANTPLLACGFAGLFLVARRPLWQERLFMVAFIPAILTFAKIFRSYFLVSLYFLSIPGGVLLALLCSRLGGRKQAAVVAGALAILAIGAASFRHYQAYNYRWPIPGVEEVTETISSETSDGDLIFGGLITPLFSFLTGRHVLQNALYTDMEVFGMGLLSLEQVRRELRQNARLKFVVMTHRSGFLSARGGRLNRTLRNYFFEVGRYQQRGETTYLLERVGVENTPPPVQDP